MKNIIIFGADSFLKKSFSEFQEKKKIKKKIIFIKDENLNKFDYKKFSLNNELCIIFSGMSGSIQYNIRYGKKIFNYNKKIYNFLIKKLDSNGFKNVYFLSASCAYPKNKKNLKPDDYGKKPFEQTSIYYTKSKIFGSELCKKINKKQNRNYITIVPATLYGKYSRYKKIQSHVLISLLHKFKKNHHVKIWGSGKPIRQFLNIYDLFNAIFFINRKKIKKDIINIADKKSISISQLARKIAKITKFKGKISYDRSKKDGAYKKVLNDKFIRDYGWKNSISIDKGIQQTVHNI